MEEGGGGGGGGGVCYKLEWRIDIYIFMSSPHTFPACISSGKNYNDTD